MDSNLVKSTFPRSLIRVIIFACFLPIIFNFFTSVEYEVHDQVEHILIHNIFDISIVFLGICILVCSFLSFIVDKDFKIPLIGIAIFSAAVFHLIHTFVFYTFRLSPEVLEVSEVYYWTLSRLYAGGSILICLGIYKFPGLKERKRREYSLYGLASYSLLVYSLGFIFVDLNNPPVVTYQYSLISRPWEFVLVLIYSAIAFIGSTYLEKEKSAFTQSIMLMAFVNIVLHLNLLLQIWPEEQLFLNSHILKLISSVICLLGVSWNFIKNYTRWDSYYGELETVEDALNVSALVSETDSKGRITFVNEQFIEISKFSKDELIGKDHRIINSGYHSNEFFKEIWECITNGKTWKGEICNRAKDGSIYWVDSTIYPSMNKAGEVTKYVSIRFDITERKRLEEKAKFEKKFLELEASFFRILNVTSTASFEEVSIKLYYQKFLDEFCMSFNWDIGHIYYVKKTDDLLLFSSRIWAKGSIDDNKEFMARRSQVIYEGGQGTVGKCFSEHRPLWFSNLRDFESFEEEDFIKAQYTSSLLFPVEFNSNTVAIVEFFSKEEKEIDRELMSVLKKVSLDLGELIARKKLEIEVIKEKQSAEKLAKAKAEFLANMSHEIRTPMNGIIGMVSLIQGTNLTTEQKELFDTVKTCSDSLLTILNDVLDFSKIDSGSVELDNHDFEIKKCIRAVLDISQAKADEKDIRLISDIGADIPDIINSDDTRIRQVLLNFISNALKFTEYGEVVVRAKKVKGDGEDSVILFSVKDSGIGISEKNQSKLFKAFSQADTSTTRKFGGTGLGLAISSKLASLLKGAVWFESELGVGSTFYFKIPLVEGKKVVKETSNVIDFTKSKNIQASVLVVEDNKVNQKIAKMMLKKFGITCDIAENGVDCLNTLETNSYDLIFMDMQMPIMDGLTATQEIVRIYGRSRPKIVAMTANVFKEDKQKCFEAGMDDFIAKPISICEINRVFKKIAA